jgi:hypothetical protein
LRVTGRSKLDASGGKLSGEGFNVRHVEPEVIEHAGPWW